MRHPPDAAEIRHIRRGYFAATSFTDAQLGRVMDALDAAGHGIPENTITVLWSDHGWHLGDTNSWCKVTNFETGARNTLLWRVPGSTNTGRTTRLVEMVDLYPTLIELAGIAPVPECKGDQPATVHCLQGTSYASAFGVGSAPAKTAVVHQWPYGTYLADNCVGGTSGSSGKVIPCVKGVGGTTANPNCSTLAGNGGMRGPHTMAAAQASLVGCPRTMAYAIRDARYRYVANLPYDVMEHRPVNMTEVVSEQLYDYENDPHETQNEAGDANYADERARLAAQLRQFLEANR